MSEAEKFVLEMAEEEAAAAAAPPAAAGSTPELQAQLAAVKVQVGCLLAKGAALECIARFCMRWGAAEDGPQGLCKAALRPPRVPRLHPPTTADC